MTTANKTAQAFNKESVRQDGLIQADQLAGQLSLAASEIEAMLDQKPGSVSEAELWTLIASRHSPEWKTAQESMDAAERRLREMNADDNVPLGLLGMGLDGVDMEQAEEEQRRAIAHFTAVNEQLRQQKQLQDLLHNVLQNRSTLKAAAKDVRNAPALSVSFTASTGGITAAQKNALQKTAPNTPEKKSDDKKWAAARHNIFNTSSTRREKEKIPLTNTFWSALNDGLRVYNATMRKKRFADKVNAHKNQEQKRRKMDADFVAIAAMLFTSVF